MNEIFEYINDKKHGKNCRVGVIVAVEKDKVIRLGWSKCNFPAGDKFEPQYGLQLACDRAYGNDKTPVTPKCIQKQVRRFGSRALRYFQNCYQLDLPL